MTDFKYQSWEDRVYEEVCPDRKLTTEAIDSYRRNTTNPNLNSFLDHQIEQVVAALAAGLPHEGEVRDLQLAAIDAREALGNESMPQLAMAFTKLGKAIKAMEMPSRDTIVSSLAARIEKLKREEPLQKKQMALKLLNESACAFASAFWALDYGETIRTTDMAHKIWPYLVDLATEQSVADYLPKTEQVKSWIRKVAPDYAKRGGRPKI